MDELTMSTATPAHTALDTMSDEELQALIDQARTVLEDRRAAHRREAVAEIKRLAKANGITVSVAPEKKKRGRPRKKGPATGQ